MKEIREQRAERLCAFQRCLAARIKNLAPAQVDEDTAVQPGGQQPPPAAPCPHMGLGGHWLPGGFGSGTQGRVPAQGCPVSNRPAGPRWGHATVPPGCPPPCHLPGPQVSILGHSPSQHGDSGFTPSPPQRGQHQQAPDFPLNITNGASSTAFRRVGGFPLVWGWGRWRRLPGQWLCSTPASHGPHRRAPGSSVDASSRAAACQQALGLLVYLRHPLPPDTVPLPSPRSQPEFPKAL